MSANVNPLAPHDLPWFVTAPGATDGLYVVTTIIVIVSTVLIGVLFFWLHSLPERMGHKKLQFEIVSVLALISLFTHMHIFWIIAVLLALVDLPDFINPLRRIADASEKMAGLPQQDSAPPPQEDQAAIAKDEPARKEVEHV